MLRVVGYLALACVAAQGGSAPPGVESPSAAAQPPSELAEQLRMCREGLVDPDGRPEDRRRWAELLFSYDSPTARSLIIELLRLSDRGDVQRALCGLIADKARGTPKHLGERLVEPLLDLLGAQEQGVRSVAALALAVFPGPDVPARLGVLAAQTAAPLTKRLAAIDALAPNAHRRDVVQQLVGLLDADEPEITNHVIAVLEPLASQTYGSDVRRWRAWWKTKSRLTDEAWLAEQLQIYRTRQQRLMAEFQAYRDDVQRSRKAVTQRLRDFQRELFRLSADQQDGRLIAWLRDSLPAVQRTALTIITARIADERKRPEGEVLTALLGLLREGEPVMRREVLAIIQNLAEPAVVQAVLAQLEREGDPTTRYVIFKALSQLDSPLAIPAMIREITDTGSSSDCVREAAMALGHVAPRCESAAQKQDAVKTLLARFQSTPSEEIALRAALLHGMAGVGDQRFRPALHAAVESEEAAIVREAIRGITAIGDPTKLPRLRTLMSHSDPLVRLEAVRAVASLGNDEADLERILTRLNPTIETNEATREAAWRGFRHMLAERPTAQRLELAQRLGDVPHLEVEYLEELANRLATASGGDATELDDVYERLTAALLALGRHADSLRHMRAQYELRSSHGDPRTADCGRRLLEAMLRSPTGGEITDLIDQLARNAGDDEEKSLIVATVARYFDSIPPDRDPDRGKTLLAALQSVRADLLGETWPRFLAQATARLEQTAAETTPPLGSSGS